jgi:hypothetical protein
MMSKFLVLATLVGLMMSMSATSWAQNTGNDSGSDSSSRHHHHHKNAASDPPQNDKQ